MSEKEEPYSIKQEERSPDDELRTADINNTDLIGFEEKEAENFRYGFTRSVAFVVRRVFVSLFIERT